MAIDVLDEINLVGIPSIVTALALYGILPQIYLIGPLVANGFVAGVPVQLSFATPDIYAWVGGPSSSSDVEYRSFISRFSVGVKNKTALVVDVSSSPVRTPLDAL